ncbi:hypothetical protein NQZ79_g8405 [Umbelopsis isabellina]|nr:hypothetical protein NQZ79_g8405 [Umbelopsis isabellina]
MLKSAPSTRKQRQRQHRSTVATFLDIKSAYDTVDRNLIWQTLASHGTNTGLLSLLKHLFDDVTTSALLANQISSPATPATGVLQGSVLSPRLTQFHSGGRLPYSSSGPNLSMASPFPACSRST